MSRLTDLELLQNIKEKVSRRYHFFKISDKMVTFPFREIFELFPAISTFQSSNVVLI
jgi:hypothetical protein